MIIYPAIDIKDGCCVRLLKGDFATVKQVADDPLSAARQFEAAGARYLHMVDLDGAKDALPKNADIFLTIAKETHLKIEVGGGIRNMETVSYYLERGIDRVILGSAAIKNPDFVRQAVARYPDRIVIGIDAKDGMVATEGWLEKSQISYLDLAQKMEAIGVKQITFTDISKDGTLTSPNFSQLALLQQAVSCRVVASGGISCLKDIERLTEMGMYGAICGKSLYSGTLDLQEAIQVGGMQC